MYFYFEQTQSSCTNLFLYIQQKNFIFLMENKKIVPYLICGSDKIKRKYGVAWHVKDMKKGRGKKKKIFPLLA